MCGICFDREHEMGIKSGTCFDQKEQEQNSFGGGGGWSIAICFSFLFFFSPSCSCRYFCFEDLLKGGHEEWFVMGNGKG